VDELLVARHRGAVRARGLALRDGFESGDTAAWSATVP
jgi:hypothetical protein